MERQRPPGNGWALVVLGGNGVIVQRYIFAGLVIELRMPVSLGVREQTEEFLLKEDRTADLVYEILPEEPGMADPMRPIRVVEEGDLLRAYMDVALLPGITVFGFLSGAGTANLLPERGRFMLHAAYVLHEGEAILFAAPSGTGKSTQARFWKERRRAEIVNEDRVILSWLGGTLYAHGAWATGTAGVSANKTAPVRAVVLLGQGEEDRVSSLTAAEKLSRLVPLCTFRDRDVREQIRIIDRVSELIEAVPVVAFDCRNHPGSVEALEGAV